MDSDPYLLFGAHNPTETHPAFLLPVFDRASGNARYYQVLSADLSTVIEFEELTAPFEIVRLDSRIAVVRGEPAIYGFADPSGEILIGTKAELTPRLSTMIDAPEMLEAPILRLEVVDFCGVEFRRKEASARAYNFLREISNFSAELWRDHTYLPAQLRRWLHIPLDKTKLPIGACKALLDTVEFAYTSGVVRVRLGHDLYQALSSVSTDLSAYVAEGLRKHLLAFDMQPFRFQLDIEDVASPGENRSMLQIASRALSEHKNATKVIIPLDARSLSASRQIASASATYAVYLDQDVIDKASIGRCLSEIDRFIETRAADIRGDLLLIPLVDVHATDLDLLQAFTDMAKGRGAIQVIAFYRTRDGEPNFPLSSLSGPVRDSIHGVTIVPENELPLGEATRKTPRSALLRAFMAFTDTVDEGGRREVLRGTTLYGLGWTRGGIKNYSSALRKSIASLTNPILPITLVKRAFCIVSSVGQPQDSIARETEDAVNDLLEEQLSGRIELDALWRKRRFVPGGSVPTTVEFLGSVLAETAFVVDGLSEAAKTMLLLQGFRISVTGRDNSIFNAVRSSESIHVSTTRDRDVGFPYIWVSLSKDRQEAFLRTIPVIGDVIPLLLGDLTYLGGARGPFWAARVLATLAYPRAMLANAIGTFVEEAMKQEVRLDPRKYFSDKLSGRSIVSLSMATKQVERMSGKRAKLVGAFTLGLTASSSDMPESTQQIEATVTIGPEEFTVE